MSINYQRDSGPNNWEWQLWNGIERVRIYCVKRCLYCVQCPLSTHLEASVYSLVSRRLGPVYKFPGTTPCTKLVLQMRILVYCKLLPEPIDPGPWIIYEHKRFTYMEDNHRIHIQRIKYQKFYTWRYQQLQSHCLVEQTVPFANESETVSDSTPPSLLVLLRSQNPRSDFYFARVCLINWISSFKTKQETNQSVFGLIKSSRSRLPAV